jgi:NDP-hexose C3-ketoreductase / dTDP-4-oxo-2-deoxy-alpha-D-pentos-2-ene 2,3-reductase
MQYTNPGRTAPKVSRLCLGTMNFGPQTSEQDTFKIMDRVLEHGISFWDAANVEGRGRGEGITEQIRGPYFAHGGGRPEKLHKKL